MFVCAYIPDFAVQAALLPCAGEASYAATSAVIVDGPANLLRIVALNERARATGLQPGMTKLQAEVCGGVVIKKRSPEEEAMAQAALLACTAKIAPRAESTAPGVVIVDVSGMERIFTPLRKVAWALERALTEFGFTPHIAMAVNPDAAMHIAMGRAGVTIAAPGEEGEWIGELPIEVLSPSEEWAEVFTQWGIRTCKELAALPETELAARLGQEGLRLQHRARGESLRTFVPYEPERQFVERLEAEEAITLLPELMQGIGDLLGQAIETLQQYALAAEKIDIRCELEVHADRDLHRGLQSHNSNVHELSIAVPVPTQDIKALLKLIELELAARPPAAAIKKVRLAARAAKPRSAQPGLFSVLTPEPEKLEITLARLREEVGADGIGAPRLLDTHEPDSFQLDKFSGVPVALYAETLPQSQLCLRRFRPPVSARVRVRPQGEPESVSFQGQTWRVVVASGPWRLSGTWWRRASGWVRNGWNVALDSAEGVGIYSVFQDAITHAWFVEGRFD